MKGFRFSNHFIALTVAALVLTSQACLKPTLKAKNASSTKSTAVTLPTNGIAVSANPLVIGAFTVTVTLGSPMTGLTLSDFNITNGISSAFTTVNSTTYTFTVTPSSVGNVVISSPAGSATVTSTGVASLASNTLTVNYDPSCTVSFTTTGATFNGTIVTTGGTTTWNMNGAITTGTNVMAQNWGVAGARTNSVKVDTGVNFTQITNWVAQNVTGVSFTLGCNGLAVVEIRYNPLTSIDVTMLPALTTLNIGHAGGGPAANQARISSFDFSKNPLLTQVWLDYCNMSSLDFHLNPLLFEVRAAYSGTLASVNVAGLTSLNTLIIVGGLLSSIDVTTNPALADLEVSFNNLSTLNVTNNPNLVTLHAASNFLTSLNITNNTLLQGLYLGNLGSGVGFCTNTINSLNFATNNQIRWVELDCNTMASIDLSGKTTLLTLLAESMPNLTTVNLTGASAMTSVQIVNSPVSTLTLAGNTALVTANCTLCNLSSFNGTPAPALQGLYLAGNVLTSVTITANPALKYLIVGQGGNTNTLLTTLDLSGNPNLVTLTMDNTAITSIDVSGKTALTDIMGYPVYSLTSLNTTGATALKNLFIYGNQVPAFNLTTNTALETLNIDYNTAVGAMNLTANTQLKTFSAIATSLPSLNISNLTQLNTLGLQGSPATVTFANNTALSTIHYDSNPSALNAFVANVYGQRAVLPVNSTMSLIGSGVPGGVTLVDINALIAGPYNWTITHD